MEATYFKTQAEFRAWLSAHDAQETELWVGYYKVSSGHPSISWKESVDEGLCFGWIDGRRQSIDAERYRIRFTPRKPKSIWSKVNLKRYAELLDADLVRPSGKAAFESRDLSMVDKYSFENEEQEFDAVALEKFKANDKAWTFFSGEARGYQKVAKWWVVGAKRQETRLKRMETLIEVSEAGKRLEHLSKWSKK